MKRVKDRLGKLFREEVPLWFWIFVIALGAIWLLITMLLIWKGLDGEKNNVDQITLTVGALGALFVGTVGLLGLYVNYRRTREFENSTNRQRESDERRDHQHLYASSFQYLEHDKESVRLGSVYGLYRLAKSSHSWASNVAEILSAHIRSITEHPEYRSRNKPSNYIDTVLRLLVPRKQDKPEASPFSRLEDFRLNLVGVHLPWANLKDLSMVNADLRGANLTGADLRNADLRNADLRGANLTSANLRDADLRGADLRGANLTNVKLRNMNLRGAKVTVTPPKTSIFGGTGP